MVMTRTSELFLTVFFAYFAMINFQMLQSIHQAQSMGLYQEDEWWRQVEAEPRPDVAGAL